MEVTASYIVEWQTIPVYVSPCKPVIYSDTCLIRRALGEIFGVGIDKVSDWTVKDT